MITVNTQNWQEVYAQVQKLNQKDAEGYVIAAVILSAK
jgi:hypothetical protein